MEALVRKTRQFTENKILMKSLLKVADEMSKKVPSNSVFPLDLKSIHKNVASGTFFIGPVKRYKISILNDLKMHSVSNHKGKIP